MCHCDSHKIFTANSWNCQAVIMPTSATLLVDVKVGVWNWQSWFVCTFDYLEVSVQLGFVKHCCMVFGDSKQHIVREGCIFAWLSSEMPRYLSTHISGPHMHILTSPNTLQCQKVCIMPGFHSLVTHFCFRGFFCERLVTCYLGVIYREDVKVTSSMLEALTSHLHTRPTQMQSLSLQVPHLCRLCQAWSDTSGPT